MAFTALLLEERRGCGKNIINEDDIYFMKVSRMLCLEENIMI